MNLIIFICIPISFLLGVLLTSLTIFNNEYGTLYFVEKENTFYIELFSEEDIERIKNNNYVVFKIRRKNNY